MVILSGNDFKFRNVKDMYKRLNAAGKSSTFTSAGSWAV
jgi:multisubunit Na+/H+ antiporter MnhG subunit